MSLHRIARAARPGCFFCLVFPLRLAAVFGVVPVTLDEGESQAGAPEDSCKIITQEFIYEAASFPECHASTIVEDRGRLVCAWFGGKEEGADDVGIWLSMTDDSSRWSAPVEVADGLERASGAGSGDGPPKRYPCWNPVLHRSSKGPLLLFYKVGPSPRAWWGVLKTSTDGGRTWSEARRLPEGILGPIKNKPLELAGGELLCPSSSESDGWRIHFERTSDLGLTWTRTGPLNDGKEFGAIQPTILRGAGGSLVALCRSRQKRITEVSSADGGKTWTSMRATSLPNPNSGIDAVTLADGRHLLVYNPRERGRSPLIVALSSDGKEWSACATLEDAPGEFSYPAVIQAADGKAHVTYTWKRQRVRHVVLEVGRR